MCGRGRAEQMSLARPEAEGDVVCVRLCHVAVPSYCSAPITTGRRNIDWQERIGASFAELDDAGDHLIADHSLRVVAPNLDHARMVVEHLRQLTHVVLIDPTRVPPQPNWDRARLEGILDGGHQTIRYEGILH